MTVSWAKHANATGYQLQYSTDKNFRNAVQNVTIKKASTVKKAISGLVSKKTYYVRIRTYKTISGTKYYSAWSGTLSVKVK